MAASTWQPPEVLPDGTYEALVVDADEDLADGGVVVLSLAITTGEAKGDVVEVRAAHLQPDPLALLAMPCILVVAGGQPSVVFD